MISHKHKCIFIHIAKCAGSSIESAFGIDVHDNSENNHKNLFGWDSKNKIHLQHATPQELFDMGLISNEIWDAYYKIIVVRNPYDRMLSDYFWISKTKGIKDSFIKFILKKGKYSDVLNNNNSMSYRGDHLNTQVSYFFVNGKKINYDSIIRFETFKQDIENLDIPLFIKAKILNVKLNSSKKPFQHYSLFYDYIRKRIVKTVFQDDLDFLNYSFEDKKGVKDKIKTIQPSINFLNKSF